jgi:hypothetical protein
LVYAKTNNGNVCFYVDEVLTEDATENPVTNYYVSNIDEKNKLGDTTPDHTQPEKDKIKELISFAITNNMSIAQESPWLSLIMSLLPTLLLLAVMM